MNHRSNKGENGFILKNGTFQRFEPIGISWNDSYCRKITDTGPSGCFIMRDLLSIPDCDYQGYVPINFTGKDWTNSRGVIGLKFTRESITGDDSLSKYYVYIYQSISTDINH